MSSFIVSTECMNSIINGLFWKHQFKDMYSGSYREQNLNELKDYKKLAKKLYLLNQKAVEQRYPDDTSDYAELPKFEWIDKTVSDMQFLKSLQCFRYQCYEGNVPQTKLYKWIEGLIHNVMNYIIDKMPEYSKAEWG